MGQCHKKWCGLPGGEKEAANLGFWYLQTRICESSFHSKDCRAADRRDGFGDLHMGSTRTTMV
eukprot:2304663-Prorocentrum_lima.AAC.1